MEYSPFDKELSDIDFQELEKLIHKSIAEGWHVEYKCDFPKKATKLDNLKIAKSISAFANTKGGWLIYGVESNDKNIATKICGIDLTGYNNIADQISQIIASNIMPKPVYHFKTVDLADGKTVFIILIEESPTPPYITSQGIIYQRENNESNPIKDRYIIEKLSEKSNSYYESIERFCQIDYGQTKGQSESNQSYLELYLFPLPFNDFFFEEFSTSDFFKQVAVKFYQSVDCTFEIKPGETISLPLNLGFNSIYSSQNSLIIRPLKEENLIYKTTTAELFINGSLKFTIPLSGFNIQEVPTHYEKSEVIAYLRDTYTPYETVTNYPRHGKYSAQSEPERITRRKETDFVKHIQMIDGAELIYVLLIIMAKYRAILEEAKFDMETEIGFRANLTNTWRKFIFFDNRDYLEKLKLYNLPIAPKNDIEIPRFIKGNYYTFKANDNYSFFIIANAILHAIGLPDSSTIKFFDIINDGLNRFSRD